MSLDIPSAHSVVFIGPSGGGKTTLLRILAGLIAPDEGEAHLNGQPLLFDEASLLRHRRTVGTVFQSFNLFPHLTALENITLPLEIVHGQSPDQARQTALDWLRRFQLDSHVGKKPGELSGGQRQRVAIARAAATKPRVLFFDEPTSALDPEMTGEVLDAIEQLRKEGSDLILVTHEMGFARKAADQVVFLAAGRVVESGASAEFFGSPRSEDLKRFLHTVLRY